jgi:hypothetical protein
MPRGLAEKPISKKLADYLSRKISLRSFHKWLVPAVWDIDDWATAKLRDLVSSMKLRLAEYSNEHWSEAELREQLRPILSSIVEFETGKLRKAKSVRPRQQTSQRR